MPHEPLIASFENADPTQIDKWGAKGAKLAEDFCRIRHEFPDMQDAISVPDGFILSTDVWRFYHQAGGRLTDELFDRVWLELRELEKREGRIFGDSSGKMPLIVAVRGGAPVSLPGALGTILNVGLNDHVVQSMIAGGEDESFVLTTYLSAIRMYGEVVLEIPYQYFYDALQRYHVGGEGTLSVPVLRELIETFNGILHDAHDPTFPPRFETDLRTQLRTAIEAILSSWMSLTAIEARSSREPKVPDDMGTAVVIQSMVFGNRDEKNCLSGVFFTRNQRTGADFPVIEWAPKVQCDKIVSGKLRKPLLQARQLKDQFPDIYERLMLVRSSGEARARRPLDMEFTVENRKLFILQRRPLRMTFNATVRSMWDFVDEGKTSIQQASMIINTALEQPEKVLRENFHAYEVLAQGEPITNSADSGILAAGAEDALELAWRGQDVILLRMRPYGETDIAVNHPHVRGIIRCDGSTTGHEAVSAVSYSKPYLINVRDTLGQPLVTSQGEGLVINTESPVSNYIGKTVFVDGERGILGYTEETDFLEDRRSRKKLYVDWEFLREQFDEAGYSRLDYTSLLDLHYEWELELGHYQSLEKVLREDGFSIAPQALLDVFSTYLSYIPERDRDRTLHLKDVKVDDFDFGPPLLYRGGQLGREVLKIMRTLMLATTWRTHWIHEIMVSQARQRGETENDVIRDIFLKNRSMSLLRSFEKEGFHVMKAPKHYYLILASNFEYDQDLDLVQVGPGTYDFGDKESLARNFIGYLDQVDPELSRKVRMVQGEPPLGQGHARIISIGLSIPEEDFDLACRYLRTFLDSSSIGGSSQDPLSKIPENDFVGLYEIDPAFAPYPDLRISKEPEGTEAHGDFLLAFGECSFGEFDGTVYGKEGYDRLTAQVERFEGFLKDHGRQGAVRPWQFEVDPYRRHSVIAAVGVRVPNAKVREVLDELKSFLSS